MDFDQALEKLEVGVQAVREARQALSSRRAMKVVILSSQDCLHALRAWKTARAEDPPGREDSACADRPYMACDTLAAVERSHILDQEELLKWIRKALDLMPWGWREIAMLSAPETLKALLKE